VPVQSSADITRNGGFAEYILADPNYVAHIPDGLTSVEAAPIICAGVTTYKGIKETGAKPGQWIAISGIGGLGHLAIQYAKVMGLQVCAIDVDERQARPCKRLGLIWSSMPGRATRSRRVKKWDWRRRAWCFDHGPLAGGV